MCAFFPSPGPPRNVAKGRLHPFAAPLGYDRYLRNLAVPSKSRNFRFGSRLCENSAEFSHSLCRTGAFKALFVNGRSSCLCHIPSTTGFFGQVVPAG